LIWKKLNKFSFFIEYDKFPEEETGEMGKREKGKGAFLPSAFCLLPH